MIFNVSLLLCEEHNPSFVSKFYTAVYLAESHKNWKYVRKIYMLKNNINDLVY